MAEIAIAGAVAVLRQAAAILGNLMVQEGSRLFKLKDDMEWIETEMGYIQAYLEDAQSDAYIKQGGSRLEATFLNNIGVLAHDVEDVVETYFPQIAASQGRKGWLGWLKNAKTARDFAVEIEGIKKRVESIKNARQTYISRERPRDEADTWDARRSFPHIDEVNVVGFDEQIEELMAKVVDEDLRHRVVSITGMAGLGKTTLAKKVYNSVLQNFECSAWICVSQQPNIAELLRDVARQVGLEKEKWEHNVEHNLFVFLSQTRYVIVIDDLWQTESWDHGLKKGIPINSKSGSRIILTSRNIDVGVHVGGQSSLHELQPLDPENSRNLFFKMITGPPSPDNVNETNDSLPSKLESIGEQILERCRGVPLAIVVTAGLLSSRQRTAHAWKGILESMGQGEDQYSKIFGLSYKDLPLKLKPCFLYLGLFPEDHEVSAFELINLWVAEGFIQGSEGIEVEDVGDDYLNHLIGRNLIQVVRRGVNGRVSSCRIHDILHSLCIRVAKEINFFNTNNDATTPNSALGVRRVTIHRIDDYISFNHRTPKLRAVVCLNGCLDAQKSLLKNVLGDARFLRVLSLRCYALPMSIPNEISNFSSLSYLAYGCEELDFVELPDTISNLKSLLTLDLRACSGVALTNVIWTMKQLRHILLPVACYRKAASSFFGINFDSLSPIEISLPNLQTLYGLPGNIFEAEWLHKLIKLRTLRVNQLHQPIIKVLSDDAHVFQVLEKLVLSGGDILYPNAERFGTLNLSQCDNLCNLRLEYPIGELPQLDKLPPNLTKLTLVNTLLKMDPMATLKKLPQLKILKLGQNSYCGLKMVCSGEPGNFPQLQLLKIESLRGLKQLIVAEGGMPNLKNLTIFGWNPPEKTIPKRIRKIMTITKWE